MAPPSVVLGREGQQRRWVEGRLRHPFYSPTDGSGNFRNVGVTSQREAICLGSQGRIQFNGTGLRTQSRICFTVTIRASGFDSTYFANSSMAHCRSATLAPSAAVYFDE